MSVNSSIRDTFFEECEDLLAALAEGLSVIEGGSTDPEVVNAVFRAVHSIKGGAGAFGLNDLVSFAHRFETVLDAVRSDRLAVDATVMRTLQRSADHLAELVEAARDDQPIPQETTAQFLAQLELCLGDDDAGSDDYADFEFAAVTLDFGPVETEQTFEITFAPREGLYRNGHEPALLIAALAEFGQPEVTLDISALPVWEEMDPDAAYLRWTIRLRTPESETALHEVFEFVEGLCDLEIRPVAEEGAIVPSAPALDPAPAPEDTPAPVVSAASAAPAPAAPAPVPAASPPRTEEAEGRGPKPTLRVDLERVDRLINAVGELIINQAMISQRLTEMSLPNDAEVVTHVEDYRLLARDIQEAVMAIRAQPVKPLFQRMSRIVREAADATGKEARLITLGDSTEVDKTVI